jgi:hypothetical protein
MLNLLQVLSTDSSRMIKSEKIDPWAFLLLRSIMRCSSQMLPNLLPLQILTKTRATILPYTKPTLVMTEIEVTTHCELQLLAKLMLIKKSVHPDGLSQCTLKES